MKPSLKSRLLHAEEDFLVALAKGDDAILNAEESWESLLKEVDAAFDSGALDEETSMLAHVVALRLGHLAETSVNLLVSCNELTMQLTHNLDSIMGDLSLTDHRLANTEPHSPLVEDRSPMSSFRRVSEDSSSRKRRRADFGSEEDASYSPPVVNKRRRLRSCPSPQFEKERCSSAPLPTHHLDVSRAISHLDPPRCRKRSSSETDDTPQKRRCTEGRADVLASTGPTEVSHPLDRQMQRAVSSISPCTDSQLFLDLCPLALPDHTNISSSHTFVPAAISPEPDIDALLSSLLEKTTPVPEDFAFCDHVDDQVSDNIPLLTFDLPSPSSTESLSPLSSPSLPASSPSSLEHLHRHPEGLFDIDALFNAEFSSLDSSSFSLCEPFDDTLKSFPLVTTTPVTIGTYEDWFHPEELLCNPPPLLNTPPEHTAPASNPQNEVEALIPKQLPQLRCELMGLLGVVDM